MISLILNSLLTWFYALINLFNLSNFIANADAPLPWQYGFQDVASPGYEGIVALHDSVMFYLVLILVSVFWVMFSLMRYFNSSRSSIIYKYLNHGIKLCPKFKINFYKICCYALIIFFINFRSFIQILLIFYLIIFLYVNI